MQIKRSPDADLYEVKFGNVNVNPVTYYVSKAFGLPHNELLFLDGFITKYKGREGEFFYKFFKENSIYDLVEEAKYWDGCWAITYINQNGSVYCFTDPLGKKQLYYNKKGDICSQIKPLVSKDNHTLDYLYFGAIQKWGYNIDDSTPFTEVKRIMPGRLYIFIGGVLQNVSPAHYFDWRWGSKELSPSILRSLVRNSVIEYAQDLPAKEKNIAILLSGGIDSSIISYELLQIKESGLALKGKNLRFYTINNQEDAPFVELFAKTFGVSVKSLSYDMKNVRLDEALSINETPVDLGSMVPNQLMFQNIPEKIIFTGDGPDEMFGGYRRIDEYDSQKSDIFHELSFYHLPRLEKASSYYGKDLRCPWLSFDIVRYALALPFEERKHKKHIKDAYKGLIPDEIIDRPKLPLKNDELRADPIAYRRKLVEHFINLVENNRYENQ